MIKQNGKTGLINFVILIKDFNFAFYALIRGSVTVTVGNYMYQAGTERIKHTWNRMRI